MVNGEISWKNPPHKFNNDKDIFLKLQEGKNKVRFVTNPFAFYIHEYQPTGAKFASKVRCSKSEPNDTCVFCDGVVVCVLFPVLYILSKESNCCLDILLSWTCLF